MIFASVSTLDTLLPGLFNMVAFALFSTTVIAGHTNRSKMKVGLIPGTDAWVLMIPQSRQKVEIFAHIIAPRGERFERKRLLLS